MPSHKSWTYVLWQFVTDDRISPFSRVIRTKKVSQSVMIDPTGVNNQDVDPQATTTTAAEILLTNKDKKQLKKKN